jgi:hypothetical protein
LAARRLFKKFEVFHNHLSLPQLDGDKKRDVSHNKKPGTCRRFFFDILQQITKSKIDK